MRDFSTPRSYVFSAHLATESPKVNAYRHDNLVGDLALAGIQFTECTGHWGGKEETSVLVTGAEHESEVFRLAKDFEQECVLVIAEHDRTCYLAAGERGKWLNIGRLEYLGTERPGLDAWTCVEGAYFAASGTSDGPDLNGGIS